MAAAPTDSRWPISEIRRAADVLKRLALAVAIAVVPLAALEAQTPGKPAPRSLPRTAWGHPDLQGVWSTATVTPLERPKEFGDKAVLTEAEAAEYAKRVVDQRNVDLQRAPGSRDVTSAYNDFWYDRGTKPVPTNRTSLIIDPPDGRVPPLTPEGQRRAAAAIPASGIQEFRIVDSWLDRGLWERCITRGMPDVMLPTAYNNNYRILQTPEYVAIQIEMIHDVRVIPLDGRPHPSPRLRQWLGSSRGRWEGDTLVVETQNFTNKTTFRGSQENLHLVERFWRIDADALGYRVTIDDPTTFTRPWTIELPVTKADGEIYEYACHEDNRGMYNLLSASRAAEKEAADAAQPPR